MPFPGFYEHLLEHKEEGSHVIKVPLLSVKFSVTFDVKCLKPCIVAHHILWGQQVVCSFPRWRRGRSRPRESLGISLWLHTAGRWLLLSCLLISPHLSSILEVDTPEWVAQLCGESSYMWPGSWLCIAPVPCLPPCLRDGCPWLLHQQKVTDQLSKEPAESSTLPPHDKYVYRHLGQMNFQPSLKYLWPHCFPGKSIPQEASCVF